MSSDHKIGEAVASLTARLTTWEVEDPMVKAHEFVRDMLDNGWRPTGAFVDRPAPPTGRHTKEGRASAIALARAALIREGETK